VRVIAVTALLLIEEVAGACPGERMDETAVAPASASP